jgi:hypothetical protein
MENISNGLLVELLIRFLLTLGFNLVQMRIVSKHGPDSRRNVYSFFIISVVVFFLAHTLRTFDMQIGMAIGMFAVFGIVRYRTETLRPQEMTYLFAAIGIAVINALSSEKEGCIELVVINAVVLGFVYLLEKFLLKEKKKLPFQKLVVNMAAEEVEAENLDRRISELAKSMAIRVKQVQVQKVDFANNSATVHVYYEK